MLAGCILAQFQAAPANDAGTLRLRALQSSQDRVANYVGLPARWWNDVGLALTP